MVWTFDRSEACTTVAELLERQAAEVPERLAYTFLEDGEAETQTLTVRQLDARARAIAARLVGRKTALLLYEPSLEYVCALFGCFYAGVAAVPAYPPNPMRLNRTLPRLLALVRDAEAEIILTSSTIAGFAGAIGEVAPELASRQWIATDQLDAGEGAGYRVPPLSGSTPALLQYTSGSTGDPKGVIITHENLCENQKMIREGHVEQPVVVSWLPPYHDMGLIGIILTTFHGGGHCVLMPPLAFLKRPIRWLQAVSRYRATAIGGPNFAYDLCVRKVTEAQKQELDLSSLGLAFTGAEPVRHETLERFAETFEPCGFRRLTFSPSYGLAEATLLVSGIGCAPPREAPHTVIHVDPTRLRRREVVLDTGASAVPLVACGPPKGGQDLRIVDPDTLEELGERRVGEIWLHGKCVGQGYWNAPDKTREVFGAELRGQPGKRYLRTGDLGFLHQGQLYITGRAKDLIIIRGQNYAPSDLEATATRRVPALRPGSLAAFSMETDGEERLLVVAELGAESYEGLGDEALAELVRKVAAEVRHGIAEEHELQVFRVCLLRAGSIPKTSSGKIQRYACRNGYEEGNLDTLGVA